MMSVLTKKLPEPQPKMRNSHSKKKKKENLEKIFKYSKKREAEQFTHTLPRLIHQNLQVALTFLLVKTPVSSEK
jgi:hypothetical protein